MAAPYLLYLFCLATLCQALTSGTYLSTLDRERLKAVFESARPYGSDLQALYQSVRGLALLDQTVQNPKEVCEVIRTNVKIDSVESFYYASSAASILKTKAQHTCQIVGGNAEKLLTEALEGATSQTIYQATAALINLALKVDATKVSAALTNAIKKDDSPLSVGYAFLAASLLTSDVTKFHDQIEDVIQQADDVEDQYLQFEGGLYTTALVIDAAYQLSEAVKKAPAISQDKVIKFANYFLSRKHVQLPKNALAILSVIKTLTTNKYHVPIAVSRHSQIAVNSKSPSIQVRVSNLFGESLGKVAVVAEQAQHLGESAVILSKKPFTQIQGEQTLFELNLLNSKPARGFYKITVTVTPDTPDARLIGLTGAEVEVKVTAVVSVDNVELGVADKDQAAAPKTTKAIYPNKASGSLELDHQQKLLMKFRLKDQATGDPIVSHQAFVRLTNNKSKQEIAFVAEADAKGNYKFDLDVGNSAKDFGFQSGAYSVDLIVGDAVIENHILWTLADVSLKFEGEPLAEKSDDGYARRPEIVHQFREPDKRPPKTVSTLFTALVLLPLLVLLVAWLRIGVNISNFPFSLSAVGFHVCLAAVFMLYYYYWVRLDMFETLRYLGMLSVPTFLFGNRLLSAIATRRK